MKALTFQGERRVRHESVADPRVTAPGDALVGVELTALCGSDLHAYRGHERGLDPGTVLGHEFVGEVLSVGGDVSTLRPGDRVASPFTTSCGDCPPCREGLSSRCEAGQLFGWRESGRGLHGAQAERVRVPLADSTLVKIPEKVSCEQALLLGDNLATACFCADLAEVAPEGVCAVIGCGAVGLLAVAACFRKGAGTVVAVDAVAERLRVAESLGAIAVSYRSGDPRAAVHERTGGRGADSVLEAVGSAEASRLAVEMVRAGGTIAAVGVHTEPHFAFSPGEAYDKNLSYRAGRCPARRYLSALLPQAPDWESVLSRIISHRVPLSEGPDAYAMFAEHRDGCVKVLLTP